LEIFIILPSNSFVNWNQLLSPNRVAQKLRFHEATRSAFEQDYDRIIFSHPFRKLQDKTQVHPLPEQDFVHTRLTHSLEVSSVGRSLGRKIGGVILERHRELERNFSVFDFGSIVAAASLAHDLGNPPFGHAGENAISDFFTTTDLGKSFEDKVTEAEWADLIKFEGNAQGFRILNKNRYGLKLTTATLGAFTKYPCAAFFPHRDKSKRSQKKFGFFQTEKEIFNEVAEQLGLTKTSDESWSRHPLAFLVEAADDICYSIIDLEDGCSLGLIPFEQASELFQNVITKSKTKLGKLNHLSSREEKIGYLRALAIADMVEECTDIFLENESKILSAEFEKALVDESGSRDALSEIINISVEKIYKARHVVEIEASGHEVLPGLLEQFVQTGIHILDGSDSRKHKNLSLFLPADTITSIKLAQSDTYNMLRNVIDFVSGLTDRHALSLYRKIKGIGI
jgi:dGTPase